MKHSLGHAWEKWILYKRLFLIFFALNIFCLSFSMVLAFSYWSNLTDAPDKVQQLIIVGFMTFVFGVLLPSYLMYRLGKVMNAARKELETAARDIAREWMKHFEKYDKDPFKNMDFWLNAILLSAEQIGRYNNHPIANLGGEMAGLVRQEIRKIKNAS